MSRDGPRNIPAARYAATLTQSLHSAGVQIPCGVTGRLLDVCRATKAPPEAQVWLIAVAGCVVIDAPAVCASRR